VTLTIYSRPGCHLCDDMKSVVVQVIRSQRQPCTVEEVDVSTNADLEARYGMEVPVLVIDGRKVAKYRIEAAELARVLQSRMADG
jgi:glutaredoxin